MKLRYTYILFFVVAFGTVSAQTDDKSSLQRTVTIEKEFTPIVQDASKINSAPELEVSPSVNPNIQYAEWSTPQKEAPSLTLLPLGDNGVESPTKQRGYAQIEIGNYLNLNANAGLRIIDKKKDQLLIWYQHNSTNGTLSYLEDTTKTKQRRNDNRLHLNYSHEFNRLYWLTSVHYRYNGFNYYGLPFDKISDSSLSTTTNQQTVQQYGFDTKITSKSDDNLHYIAEINYHAYNSDLGLFYGQRGVLENHLTTFFDGNISLNDHQAAGIILRMDNLIYNRCEKRSYTQLRINPYFTLQSEKIHFKIGLLADFSAHEGTVLRLAPDLNFEWEFERECFFYAQLTGGKTLNSWGKMSDFTVYIDPTSA
ncbi:MAG: hypothetical protein LUI04_00010, partial [Porphyromonadaceae bacterium]|nr:hypothetical protein [Porphyromonadaceae bacterium]